MDANPGTFLLLLETGFRGSCPVPTRVREIQRRICETGIGSWCTNVISDFGYARRNKPNSPLKIMMIQLLRPRSRETDLSVRPHPTRAKTSETTFVHHCLVLFHKSDLRFSKRASEDPPKLILHAISFSKETYLFSHECPTAYMIPPEDIFSAEAPTRNQVSALSAVMITISLKWRVGSFILP